MFDLALAEPISTVIRHIRRTAGASPSIIGENLFPTLLLQPSWIVAKGRTVGIVKVFER